MIRKIQPIMNMKENNSVAKNLELHILQWNKHKQKRVIVNQSFKIKAERLLLRKLKTTIHAIWQKSKPQWLRANTSAIRNSKPKAQIKNTQNGAHITLVHIYIHTWPHTHKNSNTQTHGQATINTHTHATQLRDRKRGKRVRERNWVGLFSIAI